MDSLVKTADGTGTVTEISPLTGFVKVKIGDTVKPYRREDVTVLRLKGERKGAWAENPGAGKVE